MDTPHPTPASSPDMTLAVYVGEKLTFDAYTYIHSIHRMLKGSLVIPTWLGRIIRGTKIRYPHFFSPRRDLIVHSHMLFLLQHPPHVRWGIATCRTCHFVICLIL